MNRCLEAPWPGLPEQFARRNQAPMTANHRETSARLQAGTPESNRVVVALAGHRCTRYCNPKNNPG